MEAAFHTKETGTAWSRCSQPSFCEKRLLFPAPHVGPSEGKPHNRPLVPLFRPRGGTTPIAGGLSAPAADDLWVMTRGRIKPAVVHVESHPYLPQWDLLDYCRKNGIVLQAFAALGHSSE